MTRSIPAGTRSTRSARTTDPDEREERCRYRSVDRATAAGPSAGRTGSPRPPRTRSARSAISRSSRTACARTAATTRVAEPWRSRAEVSSHRVGGSQPSALEEALGVTFHDPEIRTAALTHRSFAFEQDQDVTNERLEFLGDAVLGLVVTDMAYRDFPDLPEGDLAKLRAAIVNMAALADVARDLRLGEDRFGPRIVAYARGEGGRDYKTILQELTSADLHELPDYRIVERGPDHQKEFTPFKAYYLTR